MLYKYLNPARTDVLAAAAFRFTPYLDVNDPFECRFVLEPLERELAQAEADDYASETAHVDVWLRGTISQLGMLSLSRTKANLLMWSHYCAGHSGFVVGVDESNGYFQQTAHYVDPTYRVSQPLPMLGFGTLRPVSYTQERVRVRLGDPVPFEFLFHKSLDWAYEQEVRIFRYKFDAELRPTSVLHLFKFPPAMICEVVIGAGASSETEQALRLLLSEDRYRHVRLLRAELDRREFRLKFNSA